MRAVTNIIRSALVRAHASASFFSEKVQYPAHSGQMGVFLVGVVLHSTYVMHWCINSNNEMKESALPKSISSGIGGSSKKKVA